MHGRARRFDRGLWREQGYSEAQIDVAMAGQREALLQDTHGLSYAQVLQEDFPDTRLRQVCPPRLPRELVWGLRLSAARLFKASTLIAPCIFSCMLHAPHMFLA